MAGEQTHVSLESLLAILRRRAPWILLCVVLTAGAAYGFSKRQPEMYTATASLVFNDNQPSQQVAGLPVVDNSTPQAQQEDTNVKLIQLGDVAARTASRLGKGLTSDTVGADLSVTAQGESNIVDVSATSTSPALAAEIANTYSELFVAEQQDSSNRYYRSALALVNGHLASLSTQEKSGTNGLALQQLAESLGLLAGIRTGTVQIAQAATVPTSPISPLVTRNTILGGILGLLLGLGVAFLLEHFDQRIREPEDLRRIYQLPLLGVVPESSALARFPGRRGRAESHDHGEVAVFGLIRAQLRYCKVDRALRTLLVVSAANGDGKTTIALHLARAAASVGSRVLLLEADLRAPALAEQLVVQPGPGLQDVLTGRESLSSATQTIDLGAAALENSRGQIRPGEAILDVLVAGAGSPPNPGELIESHAMAAVLEQARSTFDLVVIDTPPLAAISDAFPLLRKVDGVIIVGRIGRDRRDAAQRLHDTLKGTDAPLLGVIANGVKAGGGSHRYSSRMGMRRKRNIQVWRPNEGKTLHEHVGLNRPLAPVAASDPQSAAGMQLGSKRRSVAPPEGEYSPPAHESAAGRDG